MPLVSNINPEPGGIVPNLSIVKLGAGGQLTVYNDQGAIDVFLDVVGYFRDAPGSRLRPVAPYRAYDTFELGAPLGPGEVRSIFVSGLPGSATGVVLNVTAVNATQETYVTVFPASVGSPPFASNINATSPAAYPNQVFTGVSGGQVKLFNAAGSVHLLVDVVGYFETVGHAGGKFVPLTPFRLGDTRESGWPNVIDNGGNPVGELGQVPMPLRARVPKFDGATDYSMFAFEIGAVVGNVTVHSGTTDGYVVLFPGRGGGAPFASNVNWEPGQTRHNLTIAALDDFGWSTIQNAKGSVHAILDVAGWFTG
jgi:hypothetical protein